MSRVIFGHFGRVERRGGTGGLLNDLSWSEQGSTGVWGGEGPLGGEGGPLGVGGGPLGDGTGRKKRRLRHQMRPLGRRTV